ncbi:MAG: hypothetical protein H7256_04215 [Bdellovibrio sp.]|nr:hypothetical protein [Bdellovibrio sp.]
MTMILNGQRNCGPKVENSLIQYFEFNPEEIRHFKMLVEKDKVKAADPTHQLLETQISLAANSRPVVVLKSSQLDKINNWYYYALRQLARLAPLKKSGDYLKKIFRSEDCQINFSEATDITLDTQSKWRLVALVLREMIYRVALGLGKTTSFEVKRINQKMMTTGVALCQQDDLYNLRKELGFLLPGE